MLKYILALCFMAMAPVAVPAAELVIAETNQCDYQVVIPDKAADEVAEKWLMATAKLIQTAFDKNGFKVEVLKEGAKAADKPGIYLGATELAGKSGIKVEQHDDWTYYQKVVGKDLIIAGNDRKDPVKTIRNTQAPLALLGTVKGACDFLREYAGVRFLFLNMDQTPYGLDKDGTLKVDTRSFAFSPVRKIAVPDNLDLKKTPMMRANHDHAIETFYYIAMNFFPAMSDIEAANVVWYKAVPPAEYAKSHPEYFALMKDGKRACELKINFDDNMMYCVTSKGVEDLMFKAAESIITNGAKTISISTLDGYCLCRCNCDGCNKLFGMKAETAEQYYARGKSGKLWQAFFGITERIRKKYPEVRVVLLNYQDTPVNAEVIKEFPENVIVKIQYASQLDFDKLSGVKFPAGICGFEETFTGFGQAGPYVPERTPEHMAEVVQAQARNNVKWSMRDGSIGYVRGMQAPAYYVYGRMMDDPAADWKTIYKEFCDAAFTNVSSQMTGFFDLLHAQIAIYSDFYGVMMPAWNRKYSRSRYHDSKWHVMSIFTPEYMADAENLLASAEKNAKDPDVKARLLLIRIEFDYMKNMSKIFYLQNAWTMNKSKIYLDPLVDAIDEWHAFLELHAGSSKKGAPKPLEEVWPEMRPFGGHGYNHAALVNDLYQQQWKNTCLNWDTKAIRAGILDDKHELKVAAVEEAPGLDSSNAWEKVTESFFKDRGGMPYTNVRSFMKVLRDKDNLYVRVESLYPSKHPEDMYGKERDGDIFKEEYVEVGIMPPGGKIYRLAANPIDGSRYDSAFAPDGRKRMTEDAKWNGKWDFAFKVSGKKGPWSLPGRVWTAWFKIPFSDLGTQAPAPGETWGFNAARNRIGQYLLWSDAPSVTDTNALGRIAF